MKKHTHEIALIFLLLIHFLFSSTTEAQYLHVKGKMIVNEKDEEIILRGMGLGGWMLQEGYMLETNSFANPQYQIRAKIVDVIGEANTVEFYNLWLANHCTRRDIDSLASWGFNSVRLPMHYNLFTLPVEKEPTPGENTWLQQGFALTDSLLKWCAANKIYLILDLHAAPGGQGRDAAISDYDTSKPSLWESEANRNKTVALWKKLAERYASEPWIGGYDLINEPNWNFSGEHPNGCNETTNGPLRRLYMDITAAIRQVDKNHIIFIEGNCWANNYNGIFPSWDTNMVASFHKYWNNNDPGSIQGFINMRNEQNIPIWLGESGENSNVWFRNAIELMEKNKIGWAWWPMKKVGSVVNPLSIKKNQGYQDLLTYWKNGGAKPSVETAKASLFQLAENLRIENCIYRKDVVDAMFRQINDPTTKPFTKHRIPGVIHLSDFDLGRYNKAYFDRDTANYHVSAGSYTAWNSGWNYRNDAVDIEANADTDTHSNGYDIGWTQDGEWMAYTVTVDSTAGYTMQLRYAASTVVPKIRILVNGLEKTKSLDLTSTGGFSNWGSKTFDDIVMYRGENKIVLLIEKGGVNLSYLNFALVKKITEVPFHAMAARTTVDGKTIILALNKKAVGSTFNATGFSVTVNGITNPITEVITGPTDPGSLILNLGVELTDKDVARVQYIGSDVKATDQTSLQVFSDLAVKNMIPFHSSIPGMVEAERFSVNEGLGLETTTDAGGGQNIGYTNSNDFLEYLVTVDESGDYRVEVRVASMNQAGKIKIEQLAKDKTVLNTAIVSLPVTGGWQTWQTVSEKIKLDAGRTLLRVSVVEPGFNINWFKFTKEVITGAERDDQGLLQVYPNPVENFLKLELPESSYSKRNSLQIRNVSGVVISKLDQMSADDMRNVYVGNFPSGLYIVEVELDGRWWRRRFVID